MKKKSLITMVLSLALVATIGAGATLAYLSTTSNVVTNTFTVGKGYDDDDALYVDEHTIDANDMATTELTRVGNTYDEIIPGDTLSKDPTVHFTYGPDSYIFVKVTGMNEETFMADVTETSAGTETPIFAYLMSNLFESAEIDGASTTGAWEKIDGTTGLNGVYVYQVARDYKVKAMDSLVPLFKQVQLNALVDDVTFATLVDNGSVKGISDITVQAAAVQFDNVVGESPRAAAEAAYNLVKDLF